MRAASVARIELGIRYIPSFDRRRTTCGDDSSLHTQRGRMAAFDDVVRGVGDELRVDAEHLHDRRLDLLGRVSVALSARTDVAMRARSAGTSARAYCIRDLNKGFCDCSLDYKRGWLDSSRGERQG